MVIQVKDREVLIDRGDLELVSDYKWHINDSGYAVWRGIKDGRKQTVRMHRLITACPTDKVVDHINHNTLDNRRSNLRVCTQSDNMRNLTNQGKGYWYSHPNQKWVAEVWGKNVGSFSTEEEAIAAVALVRAGGTYIKPERTHCKHGHSLADAYRYGKTVMCKPCLLARQAVYFKKTYVPKRRKPVIYCVRGHDRRVTVTAKGDCCECVAVRAREYKERKRDVR